jgi:hypothetical protein
VHAGRIDAGALAHGVIGVPWVIETSASRRPAGCDGKVVMSSAVNEPQDPIDSDSVIGEDPDPYPGYPGDTRGDVDPSAVRAGAASPYPAGVADIVRPLGEVGVLPLGGELDPIDSADHPVGEVGTIPGAVLDE